MEVGRRRFLGGLLAVGAALLAPLLPHLERLLPARCVEAVRGRLYPGPVREMDEGEVGSPGRWAG